MIDSGSTLEEYVRSVIRDMKKPRLICLCGDDFRLIGSEEMDWHKCQCGGWVSLVRIVNRPHSTNAEMKE